MTDLVKILVLFIGLCGFAQEKINYIDTDQIYNEIDSLAQNKKYDDIHKLIGNVNKNDSIYWAMQVNKTYYFLQQEKMDEAIALSEKGLEHNDPKLNTSFYTNKAVALFNQGKVREAIATLQEALKDYPTNHSYYFKIATYYEKLEEFDNAFDAYNTSASLNPFSANTHLKLGNLYLKQRMTAQALMCFNTYLLLSPDGSDSFSILQSLNNVLSQDNQTTYIEGFSIEENTDQFEELNMIIDNRVALQDGYETGNEINIAVTHQNHVLLAYIKDFEIEGAYPSNPYLKLFQWIEKNNFFDVFTYTVCYSIENEKFKKVVDQHHDEVVEFYQKMKDQIGEIYEDKAFDFNGFDGPVHSSFASYQLDGIGSKENGKPVGKWVYYQSNGQLKMNGQYDSSGERTGTWTMYYPTGGPQQSAVYESGNLHGENRSYFENGALKHSSLFEKDTLNGAYSLFNHNGALQESKNFVNGDLAGSYTSYHDAGETLPNLQVSYENGNAEGEVLQYDANGQLIYTVTYKNDHKTGLEKTYYTDGSLKMVANYKDGLQHGEKIEYYSNGQMNSKSSLIDDIKQGSTSLYYPDGILKENFEHVDDKLTGINNYFYPDGKKYIEYQFRKDELIGYTFFDKNNQIIKEGHKKGGKFYYEGYSPLGQISTTGLYSVKGGKIGEWNYFTANGVLTSKEHYEDNELVNEHLTYHPNGDIASRSHYKDGQLNGYYESFHLNGQLESQGYYKNDEQDKEWRHYYLDGTIESIYFNHKGNFHGEQLDYSVEGKLIQKTLYSFGRITSEEYFDHNGRSGGLVDRNDAKDSKKATLLHANGKEATEFEMLHNILHGIYIQTDALGNIIQKGNFVNGQRQGSYYYYYPNGTIQTELSYENGLLHGPYKTYYKNGNLKDVYNYVLGMSEGTSVFYAEDGKTVIGSSDFLNDESHGKRIFRDDQGNIQLIRHYSHGTLTGYSYLDKEEKEIPVIPLTNETGKIISYFSNGTIAREMEYENGLLVGAYKSYYMDGTLHKMHTNWFDENQGISKEYYPSGSIKKESSYSYGTLEGISKEYFENGTLKETTNYKNGEKSGSTIFYDQEGNEIRKDQYFNGIRINSETNAITHP